MKRRRAALISAVAQTALLGLPAAALAQAAPDVAEVIVTAQKRAQDVSDIPVSVLSLGAPSLREAGVMDLKDAQVLASGVTITSTTSTASTTVRIRGVGTVGDNSGLEPSVGVVVDGVYRPRNGAGFGDLGELERIEVLKGPQGTLFGKSTSAGLVNIVTAAPSFTPATTAEATVSNYDGWGGSASVTGPLVEDRLAGRLFVARRKRDGFMQVATTPGPRKDARDDDQDYITARAQLLLDTERADFRLIADVSRRDESCCLGVPTILGTSAASRAALINLTRPGSLPMVADPFERNTNANRSTRNDILDKGLSLQADIDLGGATLTSVTAVRDWKNARGADWDSTGADVFYRPDEGFSDRFQTVTEEVRLAGVVGRLDWLVGAFGAREIYTGDSVLTFGSDYYAYWAGRVLGGAPALIGLTPANALVPGGGQRDSFKQTNTSWALFTDNTVSITSAWTIGGGLRYTEDRKRLDSTLRTQGGTCGAALGAFTTLAGAVGAARASTIVGGLCLPWENELLDASSGRQVLADKRWTGALKSAYRWTPGLMTYVSFAQGHKASGFNFDRPTIALAPGGSGLTMQVAPTTAFPAEKSRAFELGAKAEWLGGRIRMNAALFHQVYDDFQLNAFLGTSFIVESIPRVRSQGVDLDMALRPPVTGLSVQAGVTYAETEYRPFQAADLTQPARFAGLSRLPGSRISYAPLWSANLASTYEHDFGGVKGSASIALKYNSRYNAGSDLAPQKEQPGFTLVNARVGVGAPNDAWRLEAWSMNLTNANYVQAAFNAPLQGTESDPADIRTYAAFLGAPRTFGLTLRVRR